MTVKIQFDNTYAALPEAFYSRVTAIKSVRPHLISFNHSLAELLDIAILDEKRLAQVFSGNEIIQGAEPLAQLYAGHQFGQYNPQLGDGRALLLGEIVCKDGIRRDIQLKGSGPTPYSRGGDGRAWLGPILREYVISEAMFALGIPTTRALAAVLTGEKVARDKLYPGAVLTRVAKSHIRVGTFQVFSARRDSQSLKQLYDYTVERHFPEVEGPVEFLHAVIKEQAALIPKWMGIGFIHGVMNTDNCQIAGETIDYGPCAFIDNYDPMQVFSSIDRFGRYSFNNQMNIIVWNMAQLATALVSLMPNKDDAIESFTKAIHYMPSLIKKNWLRVFAAKIGIKNPKAKDEVLIKKLLAQMHEGKADFTNTFASLGSNSARKQFLEPKKFDSWEKEWHERISKERHVDETLSSNNPIFIPRNHQLEHMINAAVNGDFSIFEKLSTAYKSPFIINSKYSDLREAPDEKELVTATYCGT